MSVTLLAVAVWCVVSVLFAAAHTRWVRYASPAGSEAPPPVPAGRLPARLDRRRHAARGTTPARAELSISLGRYARN
jgi:hypothetical protein